MAGLTFDRLFQEKNQYTDDGRLITEDGFEGAARNKTLILREGTGNAGADVTLYTVPANKILFVTSVWCASDMDGTLGGKVFVDAEGVAVLGYCIDQAGTVLEHEVATLTFPSPIKLVATDTMVLTNAGTDTNTVAGFAGWLEDA